MHFRESLYFYRTRTLSSATIALLLLDNHVCTFKARTMPDRRQFLLQLAAKLALCVDHAIRIDSTLLAQNCAPQEFSMCFWFWSVGPEALCNDNWSLLNS